MSQNWDFPKSRRSVNKIVLTLFSNCYFSVTTRWILSRFSACGISIELKVLDFFSHKRPHSPKIPEFAFVIDLSRNSKSSSSITTGFTTSVNVSTETLQPFQEFSFEKSFLKCFHESPDSPNFSENVNMFIHLDYRTHLSL